MPCVQFVMLLVCFVTVRRYMKEERTKALILKLSLCAVFPFRIKEVNAYTNYIAAISGII